MQIAHIFSIQNQHLYRTQNVVMILAHLAKKGLYKTNFINSCNQYIIMDNGAYEGQQVSKNLEDLIKITEDHKIVVDEIIIPDIINDMVGTQKLFAENFKSIINNPQYKFMYVAQARNLQELEQQINFINCYDGLNLSVGISKLCPFERNTLKTVEIYKKCKFPIHFLGLKDGFDELNKLVRQVIRSCDTNLCEIIATKYGCNFRPGIYNFSRQTLNEPNINLERSEAASVEIEGILQQVQREVKLL